MNKQHIAEVLNRHHVPFRLDEPMAKHTTWRIGGNADVFVCPATIDELRGALLACAEIGMPWTVIGRGSNLLVQDGGIRGLVLKMAEPLNRIEIEGSLLRAQAGRSFVSAANISLKHNLAGLAFATGIPGSVGGAVMMNAGAHGGEVSEVLQYADVMGLDGEIRRLYSRDLQFGYRYSWLKDHPHVVVEAGFQLTPGDGPALLQQVKQWSIRRASTQPLSLPNCGSVFRNPEGTHAAYLIEQSGLKGLRHGEAQISEKHANFIVNLGHAKASDVLWLMRHAQDTVEQKFGIHLETEVRIVGEPVS